MERIIAREVIADWNSHHAFKDNCILLPLGEDAEEVEGAEDLLVEFFSDMSEVPEVELPDEADAEIDRQLAKGKPVLVYFSEARGDLNRSHLPLGRDLEDFRKRHGEATVDSYGDEKEFRAKFAQQLDETISRHDYFKKAVAAKGATRTPVAAAPADLSSCARAMLTEACDDFEAYIGRIKVDNMLRIQANGKQLVEPQDAPTIAKWDAAFDELLHGNYIHDAGCNGQLFQITTKGFAYLKTIGKTPVGYIAELGGM